eukprot:9667865-Lingulodinium_polyedra.AAC.1
MLRVPDPGPVVPEPSLSTAPPAGELSADDELLEVAFGSRAVRPAAEVTGRPGRQVRRQQCAPEGNGSPQCLRGLSGHRSNDGATLPQRGALWQ